MNFCVTGLHPNVPINVANKSFDDIKIKANIETVRTEQWNTFFYHT